MDIRTLPIIFLSSCALLLGACGSSGGNSEPPAPPAPVAPPPPPPEPTFEERLTDLAEFDPNPCRAETPGFEALGGWLANDGRELGESRVWIGDYGRLDAPLQESHGARVWASFTACAPRSTETQYFLHAEQFGEGASIVPYYAALVEHGEDLINSVSQAPRYEDVPFPEPADWSRLRAWHDGRHTGQRVLFVQGAGNDSGNRTGLLQTSWFQRAVQDWDIALWIVVGGYEGEGDDRAPATGPIAGSSICGAADPLCLFAPWRAEGRDDGYGNFGTSHSTPQVAAALDTVWAVWPEMDILDLRNLAFDCAENMPARDGDTSTERTFSYSNGREFTSNTNSTWGHGILSLTCLFTPNGGLQNPVTGNAISGGIIGPLAGPVTGASITGVDYTGRDFGYGFARPVARENFALSSLAFVGRSSASANGAQRSNLRPVQANAGYYGIGYARGAYSGRLWQSGALSIDLTAAGASGGIGGGAIGAAVGWQSGGWMIRGGIAAQPEAVGSLTGSRAFRAPSTVSAAVTAAYAKALPYGFSMHVQADHWRTVATHGRSLWESAELAESRVGASVVKRAGPHEFSIQAAWQSGLSGSLGVDGRAWPVAGERERGVWLRWRGTGIR